MMLTEIKMPDLAATESELEIVKWLVQEGQSVKRGQALLEVQTDKAAVEVESFVEGILKEFRANVGDKVAAGQIIAIIDTK